LEDLGEDVWRASTPTGSARPDIFGGQVAGQALLAASRTVEAGFDASSVHCAFLRRGQSARPLDIRVERTRTGRTYSTRRVEIAQDGKLIFTMLATFHADEPSPEYLCPMPVGVPSPDDLPAPAPGAGWDTDIEMRPVDVAEPTAQFWSRLNETVPDDPTLHRCGLLYASDMRAGAVAMVAVGYTPFGPATPGSAARPTPGSFGSLDHALWFHRTPRIDDWFLSDVRPIAVRDSRGLVLGTIFDRAGHHVATFTQEVFLKPEVTPSG
jgi:acyl-CoA thioesterase-2